MRKGFALVVAAGLVGATVGCEALGLEKKKDNDRTRTTNGRTDRPDGVIGRDSSRGTDRNDGGIFDSTPTRGMSNIPAAAVKVSEGTNERFSYTPDRDGRVYVYDANDDRVIYEGQLRSSQRFVLNPAVRDGILVNDRSVGAAGAALSDRHQYRVYFEPKL